VKIPLADVSCYSIEVVRTDDTTSLIFDGHDAISNTSTWVILDSTPSEVPRVELETGRESPNSARRSTHPLGSIQVKVNERRMELGHGERVVDARFAECSSGLLGCQSVGVIDDSRRFC
jgi:hypothetical protein